MLETALAFLAITAQPTPPAPAPQNSQSQSLWIFISPAGEPFRASSGDYPSRTWFDLADANRDSRLTMAEMMIQARTFFNKLDRDANGRIEGDEIRVYEDHIAPETQILFDHAGNSSSSTGGTMGGTGVGGGGGVGTGSNGQLDPNRGPDRKRDIPRGAGRYSFFNFGEPIMRADADLSRSVSKDEFDALQQQQFNALDSARRGYLEFADLPRTPAQGKRVKVRKR